ncbi:hypothetical protein AAG570_004580 [Ranatra chinensis]|uniref:Glycosyltransferase family 92 protein n=1 Tax=Ranatra chinensis TaxID=642074 RepID=A0ABD0YN41_9HEMI
MGRASGRVLRERANLSFCIVVIFFAIFSVILLTEILLIDQSSRSRRANRNGGVNSASHGEEYLVYQGGGDLDLDGIGGRGMLGGRQQRYSGLLPQAPAMAQFTINITARDGVWQTVAATRYKFFVFSAYYDWRGGNRVIRVMGATKTRGPDRVWCLLWYQNNNSTYSITVPAKVIRENWNLKYSACFILCSLRLNLSVPGSVSIVSGGASSTTSNRLVVNHNYNTSRPKPPQPPIEKMAVCVKPLHFQYNQTVQMLEFIELNSLLGMDHIIFYNDTVSPSTDCILRHYLKEGRVTVLPWRLDMVSQREIRTEGLFAALNDCLYRSMYTYSHVALIDLDEIIMPKHNYTIQQFIQWMGQRINTRSTGSYSFQNAFFYLQWPDDVIIRHHMYESSLMTLRKTRRRAKLHPHKQRSKYICRPEYVVEAGNHFVWEFVPGHGTLNVPPDAAILNHYRVCEFGGDDCVKSASVVDRTAHRYRRKLVQRVSAKWEALRHQCSLPDISETMDAERKARLRQQMLLAEATLPPNVR